MKRYILENDRLHAEGSELGGELVSLKTADGTELLWQGGDGYWSGVSPNLFPVCGRLYGGSFTYGGREYALPCHGFLKETEMALLEKTEQSVTLYADTAGKEFTDLAEKFPFSYRLTLTVLLDNDTVRVIYNVTAKDGPMYFSYGGHPGFRLPMDGIGAFSDWMIDFGTECDPLQIEITPNGFCGEHLYAFPLEKRRYLRLEHSLFDIEGVFLKNMSRSATLRRIPEKSFAGSPVITLEYPDCMTLGLWHDAGTEAPFVCIEPWHGTPDTEGIPCVFQNKADIISLASGESFDGGYSIKVDFD
ncbi:MAG: hypothetical protein MJ137_09040 [Clostridia bacterium]|nr:hypothetical protein [Clostridia bacterium]